MEYELIDEVINETPRRRGRWTDLVEVFMDSEKPTMIVTCKSEHEKNVGITSVRNYIKREGYDITIGSYRGGSFFMSKPGKK